jgi:hypothetical protein
MDKQRKMPDDAAEPSLDKPQPIARETAKGIPAPTSDQTNPHNQEPTGEWVASGRPAERKNNEPGLTDEERKGRRW